MLKLYDEMHASTPRGVSFDPTLTASADRQLTAYVSLVTIILVLLALCGRATASERPTLVAQNPHSFGIIRMHYDASRNLLLTEGGDGLVKTWSVGDGSLLRTFRSGPLNLGVFNYSDVAMQDKIFGSRERGVKLTNIDNGSVISVLGESSFLEPFAFGPPGTGAVAVGRTNGVVEIWNRSSATLSSSWTAHKGRVNTVGFAASSIITADSNGTVRSWDLHSHQLRWERRYSGANITRVVFSKEGNIAGVALSYSKKISGKLTKSSAVSVLNIDKGGEIGFYKSNAEKLLDAVFLDNGRVLCVIWSDNVMELINLTNRKIDVLANGVERYSALAHSSYSSYIFVGTKDSEIVYMNVYDPMRKKILFSPAYGHLGAISSRGDENGWVVSVDGIAVSVCAVAQCSSGIWSILPHGQSFQRVFHADGGRLAFIASDNKRGELIVGDNKLGVKLSGSVSKASFDVKASKLWLVTSQDIVQLDLKGRLLGHLNSHGRRVIDILNTAGGGLLSVNEDGRLTTWSTKGVVLQQQQLLESGLSVTAGSFSPDGKTLTLAFQKTLTRIFQTGEDGRGIRIFDLTDANQSRDVDNREALARSAYFLTYSADSKRVVIGARGLPYFQILDVESGRRVGQIETNEIAEAAATFVLGGRYIVSSSMQRVGHIWRADQPRALASFLIDVTNKHAQPKVLVADADGRFEASDIENIRGARWTFDDDAARSFAPEIFMRDYYEPRLLPRLLACHDEEQRQDGDKEACQKAIKPVRPLKELNRVQPNVQIVGVDRGSSDDEAIVAVEVSGKADASQRNGKTATAAYDLRVFRDGQIVGQLPEPKASKSGADEIGAWRAESLVPGTSSQGKIVHQFRVRLARHAKDRPVQFSAYAFNEDRVKSETATNDSYRVPQAVT
ncbi:WD40 repeat domain-containing protein, partial [Microvirga sp. 0TCS3.31]